MHRRLRTREPVSKTVPLRIRARLCGLRDRNDRQIRISFSRTWRRGVSQCATICTRPRSGSTAQPRIFVGRPARTGKASSSALRNAGDRVGLCEFRTAQEICSSAQRLNETVPSKGAESLTFFFYFGIQSPKIFR